MKQKDASDCPVLPQGSLFSDLANSLKQLFTTRSSLSTDSNSMELSSSLPSAYPRQRNFSVPFLCPEPDLVRRRRIKSENGPVNEDSYPERDILLQDEVFWEELSDTSEIGKQTNIPILRHKKSKLPPSTFRYGTLYPVEPMASSLPLTLSDSGNSLIRLPGSTGDIPDGFKTTKVANSSSNRNFSPFSETELLPDFRNRALTAPCNGLSPSSASSLLAGSDSQWSVDSTRLEFSATLQAEIAHFTLAEGVIESLEEISWNRLCANQQDTLNKSKLIDWSEFATNPLQKRPSITRMTSMSAEDLVQLTSSKQENSDNQCRSCRRIDNSLKQNLDESTLPDQWTSFPWSIASSLMAAAALTHDERALLPSELTFVTGQLVPYQDGEEKINKDRNLNLTRESSNEIIKDSFQKSPSPTTINQSKKSNSLDQQSTNHSMSGSTFDISSNDDCAKIPHFILTPSPTKIRRNQILKNQENFCAGCGVYIETAYLKRLRFCECYQRYFCCACHQNHLMTIPARVLYAWDFSSLPVSQFGEEVLSRLEHKPIFHLPTISPSLVGRQRALREVEDLQMQLVRIIPFLESCRLVDTELTQMTSLLPVNWISTPFLYSIHDFHEVHEGLMVSKLRKALQPCLDHISQCPLCQAQGFHCELCSSQNLLFPFTLDKVTLCPLCKACFHRDCFQGSPRQCPRCLRRYHRREVTKRTGESELIADTAC